MLRTTCSTTQHHNPADWNIFYTRFLLAESIKSYVQDVTVCSLTGTDVWGEGITSICVAITITPQQTVTHATPTIKPVLFKTCFILIMVPLRLPAKS